MKKIIFILLNLFYTTNLFAADRIVNLVVGYKTVCFAGKCRKAIAVNNQIPAPTLHFKEGDRVSITVYNHLDEETAIHWHGILVPWQMDGVLGVNQKGIQPGQFFHYEFTLHQTGTYWYHAHAGLQEQQGLYGAFLIDPPKEFPYKYNKDYVIVLSDWSNTYPEQILANLKKEGDYYSPKFPLQASLVKFIQDYRKADAEERKKLIDDYKMMQQMRMGLYDISDVAYDAFLLNGHPKSSPWHASVKMGDVVRLRFIGAGGATIFHVKIPDDVMQMVHVQGNDVIPYPIEDFTIAPGETYDVLVKIQKNHPYIIYAESTDTVGAAYGALVTSSEQFANYKQVIPFPEPLPVTREMMDNMMKSGMDHGSMPTMNMPMNKPNSTKMSHGMHNMTMQSQHSMKFMKKPHHPKIKPTKENPQHSMPSMQNTPASTNENQSMSNNKDDSNLKESPEVTTKMDMNHDMSKMDMPMDTPKHEMQSVQASEESPSTEAKNYNAMQMNDETKITSPSVPSKKLKKMNTGMSNMNMSMNHSKHQMPMSMQNMSLGHSNHTNMSSKMKHNMQTMNHSMSMNHSMNMPTESTIVGDTISSPSTISAESTTPGTKYQNLTATVKTNNPNKSIKGVIRMELFGYMDRFIWFINGVPEYKAKPIILEPGERYRIIFSNTSMMHHPMHIHGHWFILRKGLGSYDPLLHTIDVAPGATMVADIDTDASGQWFFHCHLLYHMQAGMSRVFQYSTLIEITKGEAKPQNIVKDTSYVNRPIVRVDEARPINPSLVKHPMGHPPGIWLATFLDVGEDPFHNVQELTFKGLYGPDYNKLELLTEDAELNKGKIENADIDIFYWHLISQFWAIKGGVNYFYRPAVTPYWQPGIGIEGLMPYFIDTNVRGYFYAGSAKLDIELSRDTQITNNFFIRLGIRSILASKSVARAEIGSGLNQMRYVVRPYYRLMPGVNIFSEFEHTQNYGAFKSMQISEGESATENTLTIGLSLLF